MWTYSTRCCERVKISNHVVCLSACVYDAVLTRKCASHTARNHKRLRPQNENSRKTLPFATHSFAIWALMGSVARSVSLILPYCCKHVILIFMLSGAVFDVALHPPASHTQYLDNTPDTLKLPQPCSWVPQTFAEQPSAFLHLLWGVRGSAHKAHERVFVVLGVCE